MSVVQVSDDAAASRFEGRIDGHLVGIAEYALTADRIVFTHTEVDPAYEGHGVGSAIARVALDSVREDGTRSVVPLCPFFKSYIDRHPAYQDLVHPQPRPG